MKNKSIWTDSISIKKTDNKINKLCMWEDI